MINVYHFKNNYGDELTWFLVNRLTDENVRYCIPFDWGRFVINLLIWGRDIVFRFNTFPYPYAIREQVVMVTGALLGMARKNCIVWGCGITFQHDCPAHRAKITAVRVPYALKCVQASGISTENVAIGDPGLLMPLVFPHGRKKKYTLGIISNINDVAYFKHALQNDDSICFIPLNTLKKSVETITDDICSCEYILSSSLHGLIIAHAYGIPALRIDSRNIQGDGIKFRDYFASANIQYYVPFSPIFITLSSQDQLLALFRDHEKEALPQTDLKKIQFGLLRTALFPLKADFAKLIQA